MKHAWLFSEANQLLSSDLHARIKVLNQHANYFLNEPLIVSAVIFNFKHMHKLLQAHELT